MRNFDPEVDLTVAEAVHIAEIFRTPLDGSYNWDYRVAENRIKKLYELGKELNWNATTDINWSQNPDFHEAAPMSIRQTGGVRRRQPVDWLCAVRCAEPTAQGRVPEARKRLVAVPIPAR